MLEEIQKCTACHVTCGVEGSSQLSGVLKWRLAFGGVGQSYITSAFCLLEKEET